MSGEINSWIPEDNLVHQQETFAKHLPALLDQDSESLAETARAIIRVLEGRYRKDTNDEDRGHIYQIAKRATAGLQAAYRTHPESIRELASKVIHWPILTNPRENGWGDDAELLKELGVGAGTGLDLSAGRKPQKSVSARIVNNVLLRLIELRSDGKHCPKITHEMALKSTAPKGAKFMANVQNLPDLTEEGAGQKWWEAFESYLDDFGLHDGVDTLGLPPVKTGKRQLPDGTWVEVDETKGKAESTVRNDAKGSLKRAFLAEFKRSKK